VRRALLGVALVALLVGCSDPQAGDPLLVTGTWEAAIPQYRAYRITVAELSDGTIHGTGTVTDLAGTARAVTVTGTRADSILALELVGTEHTRVSGIARPATWDTRVTVDAGIPAIVRWSRR